MHTISPGISELFTRLRLSPSLELTHILPSIFTYRALANQSLATQKAQLAVVAGKIHGAQEIQANTRFGV